MLENLLKDFAQLKEKFRDEKEELESLKYDYEELRRKAIIFIKVKSANDSLRFEHDSFVSPTEDLEENYQKNFYIFKIYQCTAQLKLLQSISIGY